jgi:hypothetical protein
MNYLEILDNTDVHALVLGKDNFHSVASLLERFTETSNNVP